MPNAQTIIIHTDQLPFNTLIELMIPCLVAPAGPPAGAGSGGLEAAAGAEEAAGQ